MLGHAVARQPAPMLAMQHIGLRLRHGVDALGNAIGESLAAPETSRNWFAGGRLGDGSGGAGQTSNPFDLTSVDSTGGSSLPRLGDRALDRLDIALDRGDAIRAARSGNAASAEAAAAVPQYNKLGGDGILYAPTATDVPPVVVTGSRAISTAESYSLAASLAGEFAVLGYGSDPGYTAAIASGMGGIEGRIGRSVAPYVSTAATAPGRFKTAVLNDLDERGRVAVSNGNYRTLAALGVAHTATNMLLPGSPQELALAVGGGAVLGKAVGALNATLSRAALGSSSFKFMAADLGEVAGRRLDSAMAGIANAFRPTRLASDMSFEQTEALKNLATTAYEQLQLAGNSHNSLRPALSVAQDMVTGEVRLGLNQASRPDVLASQLGGRVATVPEEIMSSYLKSPIPGSHAEVQAINDLLLARPGASLNEIAVYTIETGSPVAARGLYKPACPVCSYILDGVFYVK